MIKTTQILFGFQQYTVLALFLTATTDNKFALPSRSIFAARLTKLDYLTTVLAKVSLEWGGGGAAGNACEWSNPQLKSPLF